ncbi:hypothetical protein [Thermogutta sp.]|uniref:hypothetical protein n=1 Tax=Thermogutta sp. TaxID=1962930 RepID=UPI00321F7C88
MANTLFGFVEISGSNNTTLDASNVVQIDRKFVGPAARVIPFVRYMSKKSHPVARWAYPVSIRIEPYLGDATRSVIPRDPSRAVIGYDVAIVTITYGVNTQAIALWPEGWSVPHHRRGTWLELRLDSSGEFMQIESAAWEDNKAKDPAYPIPEHGSPALQLYIPQQRITVVWHGVPWVPKYLDFYVSKVNAKEFLGKPAETLLFENYSIQMETVLDLNYPVRWAVSCNFLYRCVQDHGPHGWNEELRRDGWRRVFVRTVYGLRPRYDSADFNRLFR